MSTKSVKKASLTITLLTVMTLAMGLVVVTGGLGVIPSKDLRTLGKTVVINSFNPWNTTLTSFSLNTVTAVIWDYRGIDTVFETAVLFTAIVGLTTIFRNVKEVVLGTVGGLSVIARTATKLVILLTAIASASIAVHGHITPGGGFQGGSILAVAVALTIVVYSIETVYRSRISIDTLLKIRYTALLLLLLVALTPLLYGLFTGINTYVVQNTYREGSLFTMPTVFLNTPLGGSIFFFNLTEYVVVATSLSVVALVFSMRLKELGMEE